MKQFFLFVLLYTIAVAANAQLDVADIEKNIKLESQSVIILDYSKKASPIHVFQFFKSDSTFSALKLKKTKGFDHGYITANMWVVQPIVNSSLKQITSVIEIDNSQVDSFHIYKVQSNTITLISYGGDHVPKNDWTLKTRNPIAFFDVKAGEQYFLLISIVKNGGGTNYPVYLWQRDEYVGTEANINFLIGLILGILLLVVFYSIVLFLALKNQVVLLYSFYVISFFFYVISSTGVGYDIVYPFLPAFNSYLKVYMSFFCFLFFVYFSIEFLNIKTYFNWMYKPVVYINRFVLFILILTVFLFDFFKNNVQYIYPYITILMLIVVLFMGISGVMLIKKEKWKGIFYTLGYAFEIGGIAILIIKEFGWLASNFFTVNAFWISSVAEHVVFSIGISLIVKENIDEKNTLSAKLIEKQKEVINNFYKGQDRERERIARDLHDSVAGSLIAANYMLPTKISELNSDKQAIIYQKAKEILHLVIEEIRKISHDLLPPTFIEKYFYEELQLLVNRYDLALKSCKVMLIFNLNKTTRFQKELHVFRIIQELIHNSIKHSKADLIKILADDFDNQIVFTVMDNGIGFSNEEKFEGIGYQNIRGRLAAIDGGDLKVKSSNKGTIVTLTINKIAV